MQIKLALCNALSCIFIISVLTSCSVGMALSGTENPDLTVLKKGNTRDEVEISLGDPVKSSTLKDGTRVDVYEFERGNAPSAGRAIGHAAMDVLTFGAWEIIGTPIEGFSGTKHHANITYDENDTIIDIKVRKISGGIN